MRLRDAAALALLVAADIWILITIITAVTGGKGHGAVFWTAVCGLAVILGALLWLTRSVAGAGRPNG